MNTGRIFGTPVQDMSHDSYPEIVRLDERKARMRKSAPGASPACAEDDPLFTTRCQFCTSESVNSHCNVVGLRSP